MAAAAMGGADEWREDGKDRTDERSRLGDPPNPSAIATREHAPIDFFYKHLHDQIRCELDALATMVLSLETDGQQQKAGGGHDHDTPHESADARERRVMRTLASLQRRYAFLEQVYKYHSSVEDEVRCGVRGREREQAAGARNTRRPLPICAPRAHPSSLLPNSNKQTNKQVVYPALDARGVRNYVTSAYTVEHADEEALLGGTAPLLAAALAAPRGAPRRAAVRALSCQVEAVHTTLRKHLAKEQAQLLPLLRAHFTRGEQARLVAQFIYCIPCATVERVLAWLRPRVPLEELEALSGHLREAVPDRALLQLVEGWLRAPAARAAAAPGGGGGGSDTATPPSSPPLAKRRRRDGAAEAAEADNAEAEPDWEGEPPGSPPQLLNNSQKQPQEAAPPLPAPALAVGAALPAPAAADGGSPWPPLRTIALFHEGIRGALEAFAAEAEALLASSASEAGAAPQQQQQQQQQQPQQQTAGGGPRGGAPPPPPGPPPDAAQQLAALVERHRFLRAVCSFHTSSEEEVVLPEVLRLAAAGGGSGGGGGGGSGGDCPASREAAEAEALAAARAACAACMQEHADEAVLFDELGRLLSDARALSRRGRRREARGLLADLAASARRVCAAIAGHMAREEADVLPVLEARLCRQGQRSLVWGTLRAMPLRLLERVAPWLAARHLCPEDAKGVIETLRLGAPEADRRLVELLVRWAERSSGRGGDGSGGGGGADGVGPASALLAAATCDLVLLPLAPRSLHADGLPPAGPGGSGTGDEDGTGDAPSEPAGGGAEAAAATAAPARQAAAATAAAAAAAVAAAKGVPKRRRNALAVFPRQHPQQPRSPPQGDDDKGETEAAAAAANANANSNAAAQAKDTDPTTAAAGEGGGDKPAPPPPDDGFNPIDHIFQFHRALTQELAQLEDDAAALEAAALAWTSPPLPAAPPPPPPSAAAATAAAGTPPTSPLPSPARAARDRDRDRSAVHAALTRLHGRFTFLQGIYRAHSRAEDEIVFPALEAKQALRNVSHAYTLDHQEEAALLDGVASVVGKLRALSAAGGGAGGATGGAADATATATTPYAAAAGGDAPAPPKSAEMHALCLQLRRQCAAVRASLETHVRAEEAELWPLFAEHFTRGEQQDLVGCIIGRTGAEVLQSMLPWVAGVVSTEERAAMMGSLRDASRHTAFERWLGAAVEGVGGEGKEEKEEAGVGGGGDGDVSKPLQQKLSAWDEQVQALMEVAEYLGSASGVAPAAGAATAAVEAAAEAGAGGDGDGAAPAPPPAAAAAAAATQASPPRPPRPYVHPHPHPLPLPNDHHRDPQRQPDQLPRESARYAPGWADIFELNQQQLEAAVRRLSSDTALDASRRAYLVQHLMAARYVVAQQRRLAAQQQAQLEQQAPAGADSGSGGGDGDAVAGGRRGAPTKPLPPHVSYRDARAGVLGCQHYARAAMLVAPCCNRPFPCRLCHDEAVGPAATAAAARAPPSSAAPSSSAAAAAHARAHAADHAAADASAACGRRLDRYSVREMVCMLCGLRQPCAGECSGCASALARYYCAICHLWEDGDARERPVYHCPFCNVCRRGRGLGIDVFHCMRCNACMSLSVAATHSCRERAMEGDCPVCGDALFDSAAPVKELPCSHLLHSACFAQHTRHSYQCPVCARSAGDMTAYWRMLDSLLESERAFALPPEYAGRVQAVRCRDCARDGEAPWHFVYHACPHCRSYNTRVL